jgi:hypothetical protein
MEQKRGRRRSNEKAPRKLTGCRRETEQNGKLGATRKAQSCSAREWEDIDALQAIHMVLSLVVGWLVGWSHNEDGSFPKSFSFVESKVVPSFLKATVLSVAQLQLQLLKG